MQEKTINGATVRVMKQDITLIDVDAFVYYASPDLKLGTGFGVAISVRGGPSIQEELDHAEKPVTTQSVVTAAGELKARHIIHAVGPRFQEPDTEAKLAATVRGALAAAEQHGVTRLAFPPMGCGLFGVPLDTSARVMLDTIKQHLAGQTGLKEISVCVVDNRELAPFEKRLTASA